MAIAYIHESSARTQNSLQLRNNSKKGSSSRMGPRIQVQQVEPLNWTSSNFELERQSLDPTALWCVLLYVLLVHANPETVLRPLIRVVARWKSVVRWDRRRDSSSSSRTGRLRQPHQTVSQWFKHNTSSHRAGISRYLSVLKTQLRRSVVGEFPVCKGQWRSVLTPSGQLEFMKPFSTSFRREESKRLQFSIACRVLGACEESQSSQPSLGKFACDGYTECNLTGWTMVDWERCRSVSNIHTWYSQLPMVYTPTALT